MKTCTYRGKLELVEVEVNSENLWSKNYQRGSWYDDGQLIKGNGKEGGGGGLLTPWCWKSCNFVMFWYVLLFWFVLAFREIFGNKVSGPVLLGLAFILLLLSIQRFVQAKKHIAQSRNDGQVR